jgi:hypothetical protein
MVVSPLLNGLPPYSRQSSGFAPGLRAWGFLFT